MSADHCQAPQDLVGRYAQATGRNLDAFQWYQAFAAWKLGIVLEASYAKYLSGESKNPNHEFFGFVVDQLMERAQYPTLMQDVLAQVIGVNDYAIRYQVQLVDGRLVVELHPTSPAYIIEATERADDPRQVSKVCEEWHYDGKPVVRVWTDEATYLETTDGQLIEGTEALHNQGAGVSSGTTGACVSKK